MFSLTYGATLLKLEIGTNEWIWVNTSHISTVKQQTHKNSNVVEITLSNGEKIDVFGNADDIVKAYCKEK